MAEVFALKAIDHDNVATVFTNDVKRRRQKGPPL